MNAHVIDQQVNLYLPILGAERRLFSARAIGVALLVLAVCLAGLSAYAAWHTGRIERSMNQLDVREAADRDLAERTSLAARPATSMPQLDADARTLSGDIEACQRALDLLRRISTTTTTGFAARLEALGRRQLDGIWLRDIMLGSGTGRLAMRGGTTDARLVPSYLAALAEERALAGVHFDKLVMRRAVPNEEPAQLVFELGAPGLKLPAAQVNK